MTNDAWRDMIVGERMSVDRSFDDRIRASPFSRQQWGLVMTAVEFQIEKDGESSYRLIADTSKLGHVLPEIDRMASQGMGDPGAASGRGSSGLFGSVKSALGLGGSAQNDEQREAAERLTSDYARELQSELEENGKWDLVVERATADVDE